MLAGAAVADPYPFEGFFALERPGEPHAGCGFDILHQTHSGAFSGYLLDRRHWETYKTPRFLRYKHGTCTFDGKTGIDACVTETNHIAAIQDAKPDRAKITVIDDDAVAMLTLGEGDDDAEALAGVPPFVFRRCPFAAEAIAPLLTDGVAGYTTEELREMARTPDTRRTRAVLDAIAGSAAVD